MSRVVIDTNKLFSMLITKSSEMREKFVINNHEYYAPNYVFIEIFAKKEKILKFTEFEEDELLFYLHLMLENINFINELGIALKNKRIAYQLCKNIDIKDTMFVALALELNAMLWTGDQKLKNGLRKKGFDNFFEE